MTNTMTNIMTNIITNIIPLLIYQSWPSDILPNSVKNNIENIKLNNPEFTHYLYNDDMSRDFISNNFNSDILYAYDSIIPYAFKSDLWRYCILYKYGGIYLDIKYTCCNNFKFIDLIDKEYFCNDNINSNNGIYNGLIICKPKNHIMLKCIYKVLENIDNLFYSNNGLSISGSLMMTSMVPKNIIHSFVLNYTSDTINGNKMYYICYYNFPILQININYKEEQSKITDHWSINYINKNIYVKKYAINNYHNSKTFNFALYNNCIISNIIKTGNKWEPYMHNIFEKYINLDSIVLEGGCHIGTHTLKLASLCKHLHAFEPLPSSNKLLTYNLKTNNITNVSLYCEGLSDLIGKTQYAWVLEFNPGCAGLMNNPMPMNCSKPIDKPINVKLTTIDTLNLQKLDFIKLDIEGYELMCINGGINTIKKYKPIIILESWSSNEGTYDINYTTNTFNILINIGYNISHVSEANFLFLPIL